MREDLRIGNIASMIYNALRTKKSQPVLGPADFLLFSDVPLDRAQRRAEGRKRFAAAVARAEANIARRERRAS